MLEKQTMILQLIQTIEQGVTALTVLVGVYQLWQTKKANQTQFEDDLSKEYR